MTDQSVDSETTSRILSLIDKLGSSQHRLGPCAEAEELVEIGQQAIPLLIQNITRSDYIPIILGRIGDRRAFEALADLAKSPRPFESDSEGRRWYAVERAIRGLGLLGDERAAPLLSTIMGETNIGEVMMAAQEARENIEQKGAPSPSGALEGKSALELERMAFSEETPPEVLDLLADDPSWRIRGGVAMNPSASVETLRKLSKAIGAADGAQARRNVHFQLVKNPNCPSDVLAFIEQCSIMPNLHFLRNHQNYVAADDA